MLKKSVMLVAALAMLALPSVASGSSWGVVGTTHVLDSSNFSVNVPSQSLGWTCSASQLHVDVISAGVLTVTNGSMEGCTGTGANGAGCQVTVRPTSFPWRMTGVTPTNVQVHGKHFDIKFHAGCATADLDLTVMGTISFGVWDAPAHQVTYSNATGLTSSSVLGNAAATTTGTWRDTSQTLTLT